MPRLEKAVSRPWLQAHRVPCYRCGREVFVEVEPGTRVEPMRLRCEDCKSGREPVADVDEYKLVRRRADVAYRRIRRAIREQVRHLRPGDPEFHYLVAQMKSN